jgi:rod shape-determining protein MreC
MGVTSGTGIVGTVYLTSAHHSLVIPVLNSRSNISVAIQKRGYFGYLQWSGGDSRTADVNDVPRHAHFRLYDKVVTSGYSSIFPPGLMVGKVLHVYNSDDGMSYRLKVQLSTDFGRLRDVCVIDNAPMEERINLIRAAQDSIGIQAQ